MTEVFLNVGLIGQEIPTFDSVALNNVNPEEKKKAKSIIHIHLFSFGPTPDFVNMISAAPLFLFTGETLLKFLYLRAETITIHRFIRSSH